MTCENNASLKRTEFDRFSRHEDACSPVLLCARLDGARTHTLTHTHTHTRAFCMPCDNPRPLSPSPPKRKVFLCESHTHVAPIPPGLRLSILNGGADCPVRSMSRLKGFFSISESRSLFQFICLAQEGNRPNDPSARCGERQETKQICSIDVQWIFDCNRGRGRPSSDQILT